VAIGCLLQACSSPPEVLIDDSGVAHIYAATDEDAWYAAGYQVATDRLYQMEMLRRFAHGRLAEVVGEEGLRRDIMARTFDLPRWGRLDHQLTKEVDPERAGVVDAWVDGINRRIEEVRSGEAARPFGCRTEDHDFVPEPWTPEDPYIVLKGAGLALDQTLEFEIALSMLDRLYGATMDSISLFMPAHPVFGVPEEDRPGPTAARTAPRARRRDRPAPSDAVADAMRRFAAIAKELPRPKGSNNWAVAGTHTASGRPLLAGDPHLGFDFFGAPYPLHVNSADAGGTYDVAGFAYPGTPGIALGHNRRLAWTATSAFGDVMDVWRLQRSADGTEANVGGEMLPIATRVEDILVRGEGDPVGSGRVEIRVYESIEGVGVILPEDLLPIPLGDYLVAWTGFTARPARWFMELNRAENLDDFEAAVGRMREMNYNFVAATAEGIAYRVGVEVPVRTVTDAVTPWRAMAASDPTTLWSADRLDADRLPAGRDPESGRLSTANNDPFGFTEDGRVDDDPWYYGALFAPGYRARRIDDELARMTAAGAVTIEDMQALQADLHSTLADDLLPLLTAAHGRIGRDDALSTFRDDADLDALIVLLAAWDRRMARDSSGALAFHAWLRSMAAEVMADDIPLAWDFAIELQTIFPLKIAALAVAGRYPDERLLEDGADVALLRAAQTTSQFLRNQFGSVQEGAFSFADRKVVRLDHALGWGMPLFDRASDGGEDTVNVSQNIAYDPESEVWPTTFVSVERTTFRFAEDGTPEAWVTFPLAASADADADEHDRALTAWIDVRPRRLLFDRQEIEAVAVRRIEVPAR
jgi:penicillin amidase